MCIWPVLAGFWPAALLSREPIQPAGRSSPGLCKGARPGAKGPGLVSHPRAHRVNARPIPARPCGCLSSGVGLAAAFRRRSLQPEPKRHIRRCPGKPESPGPVRRSQEGSKQQSASLDSKPRSAAGEAPPIFRHRRRALGFFRPRYSRQDGRGAGVNR